MATPTAWAGCAVVVSNLLRGSCLECIALRILSLTLTVNSNATWPIELTVGCTHASGQNKSRGPAAYCASDPLIERVAALLEVRRLAALHERLARSVGDGVA